MTPNRAFPRSKLASLVALALVHMGATAADSLPDAEGAAAAAAVGATATATVVVSAKAGAYRADETAKGSASSVAPTQASMQASEPQSIITREFIELSVAPTAEYSRIVNIAPSMSGDSANGPGLSETKTTMRGFGDDQYNITFDGIPWGDTNNPAHHSTSFFPGSVIGGAVVERGPGMASNFGYATFGGSINLYSKQASKTQSASVFGSVGTWGTALLGGSYESGRLRDYGNATVQLNYQHLKSDGYLTGNSIKSDNYFIKFQRAIGTDTLATVVATDNEIKYVQPDNSKGPTLSQIAQFGRNYSLNDDPTSFNYTGYNHTTKHTDFSYLRLETSWGDGVNSDNQVYTYAYDNQTISSSDPTGATLPGTKAGAPGNKDIPGIDKQNKYRAYGDIFKLSKQFGDSIGRAGFWYEYSDTDRHQYDLDLTLNVRDPRETKPAPVTFPSVLFDQQSTIRNFQPFVEFEWAATDSLTVTPGVKAVRITRAVDADVNQSTRLPQHTSVDYHATLPFLTANQRLGADLAVYAQYAKGFQIPDLKSFYIADPTRNSSDPQLSTNYQLGVVGKQDVLTWDVDLYRIDFTNKYVSNGLGGTAAAYVNIGGVTYKGVEGQLTWAVGNGLALYANGSSNKATANDTGKTISGSPDMTAALGALYNAGPWSASLIYKRTGEVRQVDYDPAKPAAYDQYLTPAYGNTDLSVAYRFQHPGAGIKTLKLQFNVFNLLNRQEFVSISPGKTAAFDQYISQAPRSVQLSVKADF
ncbi:TonB-dependent receptor [Duganella sp. FT3S]|uniref:TonB-dependent receptor n=1 Tax=Rugamonas fusca TaxID=2758568 RepID=A0A7W2EKQ1_9BURK|nr:TonB-dependent receptor [Rugamonas fusca]MBA5607540.1 TonB-dependent receptor [Rugamonas fusca]